MPWTEFLYWWLGCSALVSLVVLTLGSIAVLLCRQPTRRLRIIELSLAGCLVAPWLGMIPGYPQLAIGLPNVGPRHTATIPTESPVILSGAQNPATENSPAIPGEILRFAQDDKVAQDDRATHDDKAARRNRAAQRDGRRLGRSSAAALSSPTIAEPAETPAEAWDVGSWLVAIYLLGVAIGVAWWLAGMAALVRIIWTARAAPPRCRQLLAEIAGRRAARVRLLTSHLAKQPFASVGVAVQLPFVGVAVKLPPQRAQLPPQRATWRRAVIVLPEGLCGDDQSVRLALAHEWTHIERSDFRAWFVAGVVRMLFFYQPLVWWLRGQLRLCQDFVADARASRQAPQPEDYAEFLTVRAAAGSLHPAMVGLGMGFSKGKSELYRRVIMLVNSPSLESRPPRLWSVLVTCAALALVAVAAALATSPQAAAQGESAGASQTKPAIADRASATATSPFSAKLPSGITVELLGVSEHPSKEKTWWRPDGSPLAEPPCDPLKGPVDDRPKRVARDFAIQLHNLPAERVGWEVSFDPTYDYYSGAHPERLGKDVPGLKAMTVSLPDQQTVTVRVSVAAGPWQTVCETERGGVGIGLKTGGFAFSPVYEKDGNLMITATHNIVGPESRIVAVGLDGREHTASSVGGEGADNFMQLAVTFRGLSQKDVKLFRVQTRPYQQVEFRNVSLRPGQKTDVQASAAAAGGIQPLDLLTIRVLGTIIDQPIDGVYLVEPSGKVALGPVYGRVDLKGHTLESAEQAIQRKLSEVLTRPEVQVTTAGRVTQWREGQPPAAPYRIRPGSLLQIRVVGTIISQPIEGDYVVEPSGAVPLGPAYGRVKVSGMLLEEAEEAIAKRLSEILAKPEVCVTLAGWKTDDQLKSDGEATTARRDRQVKTAELIGRKQEEQKRIYAEKRQQLNALRRPIKSFTTADKLIAKDGVSTDKHAWRIDAAGRRTVRLFEISNPDVEECAAIYRAKLKSEKLEGRAYLEMWCRMPDGGEFFSRGLDNVVQGTNDWASYETPFFLKQGERPDLIKLNLVVEGKGTLWIKDAELFRFPLPVSADRSER